MFPHVAQRESTHETTDHKTAPIEGEELARCLVVQTAQLGQTKIVNHSTAYTHFTADIHENSDHAEDSMRIFERADTVADLIVVGEVGQVGKFEKHRQQHKDHGKAQIRNFNGISPVRRLTGKKRKNQPATNDGADGRAKRVERL